MVNSSMKRNASSQSKTASPVKKKPRTVVPDYLSVDLVRDENGLPMWPAPQPNIDRARQIIRECAQAGKPTLIVPDKDADGLTSGLILYRTLVLLGLSPDLITVHLLSKGQTIHADRERQLMSETTPTFVFVLDQGSRNAPPVVTNSHTALVIDHHHATDKDFPQGADFVTACHTPPVATSSLLTYHICEPLHPDMADKCDWLCVVGTHGDLGSSITWKSPFPDMSATLKRYRKKTLNDVVSAVNAPRRTPSYDVISAWTALHSSDVPGDVLKHKRLAEARAEVSAEVERCTHTAPKFSPDGKIAVFKINSKAQVHPVIATRWAGHLNSKALEVVMVANEGYLDDKVNFSCRVAKCAKSRDPPVNIIETLKQYAALDDVKTDKLPLIERLGADFARGHVQASGGIVSRDEFDELIILMRIGERSEAQKKKQEQKELDHKPAQTNSLKNYFSAAGSLP